MPKPVEEFRSGQRLKASDLEALRQEAIRLGKITSQPPVFHSSDESGIAFRVAIPQTFPIKLTSGGTGGKYAWTRQVATASGTWTNDPSGETGTVTIDPVYEYTGNTMVNLSPNPVVRAYREKGSNALFFMGGTC